MTRARPTTFCDPSSRCANPNNATCCQSTRAIDWPSSDPLVTGVGGTQLQLNARGNRTAPDSVWNDLSSTVGVTGPVYTWGSSGGGLSTVFSRPQFQNRVAGIVGDSGGTPDIAMSAAVNGAVDFYDTTDPSVAGWGIVGGTSEASPLFSGIVALADQYAGRSLGYLNPALYAMAQSRVPDGIVPISHGSNSFTFCVAADVESNDSCASGSDLVTVPGFNADGYYNDATGWGTVNAASFVPALARFARYRGRNSSDRDRSEVGGGGPAPPPHRFGRYRRPGHGGSYRAPTPWSWTWTASRSAPKTRTLMALSARSGCQAMICRWRARTSSSGRTVAMPSSQR